jgi:polyhydroxyalkanoate synthesis regulator phasin
MEFFQQIWSQALTTVAHTEEEAQKLLSRVHGVSQDEARKLGERLAGQRRDLERRVEEVVKASVSRLRVPRRDELTQLNARLDALAARLEALSR